MIRSYMLSVLLLFACATSLSGMVPGDVPGGPEDLGIF